jgi:type II restriction/modification system DNA methylase subunit YeeA
LALEFLNSPNPHGLPNSDVVRPSINASQFVRRGEETWVIDFGLTKDFSKVVSYEAPIKYVRENVLPLREGHREAMQEKFWWLHARPSPRYREVARDKTVLITPAVSKHRIFGRFASIVLADHALIVYARADDFFFGVLQSHFHEVWALKQGTRLETRPRYTPTTCFETFPFPRPTPKQEAAIAAAAQELNALRERWLNPPEWTVEKILEFPGSVNGAWARYVVKPDKNGVGTVRYPRLEPRDADCAAKLKDRTLTKLYNERPAWLDLAHKKLDAAVAAAYGFPADLTDEQILEKLLALNLERAAEEAKAAKVKKPKTQREKKVDEMV